MLTLLRSSLLAGVLLLPAVAQAETLDDWWAACTTSAQSPDAGVEGCTKLLEQGAMPKDSQVTIYINRAVGHYAAKRFEESVSDNTAALGLDPENAAAYSNRGDGHYALGRYSDAVLDYTSALERDPSRTSVHHWRGNAYFSLLRYADAIRDFDIALAKEPDDADMLYDRGRSKALLGLYEPALADYDAALAKDSSKAFLHYDRGVALHNLRRYDEADREYAEALRMDGTIVDAMSGRAGVSLDKGDAATAETLYRKAVAIDPKSAFAVNGVANALMRQDKYEDAITWYTKVIDLGKPTAWNYADRARAKILLGRLDATIPDADEAIKLDARNGDAYYLRGLARHAKGDGAGAESDLDRAIAVSPDYVWSIAARAEFLVRDGELVKARPFLDRMIAVSSQALERATDDPDALNDHKSFLGWARALTGDKDGVDMLESSLEAAKSKELASNYIGVLQYLDGDYEGAAAAFNQAERASLSAYGKAENRFERGRVQEKLGAYSKARADYAAAMAFMPGFAEPKLALDRIAKLKDTKPGKNGKVPEPVAADEPTTLSVKFGFDTAEINKQGRADLRAAARAMKAVIKDAPNALFLIEGYTDSAGGPEYNLDLSRRRAEAVHAYLTKVGGVPVDNLKVEALGADSAARDRSNRRVYVHRASVP